MKTLIISSATTAVLALGLAAASAQSSPQGMQRNPQGNSAAALTPEQRAAIRTIIKDKLADEMRGSGERLANAAATVKTLTPEQQAAVRRAIKDRVASQLREGLADRVANQVGDTGPAGPATLTPRQRAAIRSAISEKVSNDMRGNVGEKLADAAAALKTLTPEQQAAVRTMIRNKVAAEVRAGLGNRIADQLGD